MDRSVSSLLIAYARVDGVTTHTTFIALITSPCHLFFTLPSSSLPFLLFLPFAFSLLIFPYLFLPSLPFFSPSLPLLGASAWLVPHFTLSHLTH
mmetsp:Transcript_28263/g.72109  ORF Transcript_28263/g.72109 Transcript_28263/m.72109 type:complete len:94 (+) Transcript_28263:2032-2313(+)